MPESGGATSGEAWVFHRGALGDGVLLWPALRAMAARGRRVTLVADASRARLAEAVLGVRGLSAERPEFNALWTGEPLARRDAAEVHAWLGEPSDPVVARWGVAAAGMFPGARVTLHPGRPDRALALSGVQPALTSNPGGPVVMHVGAGGEPKRWPVDRWAALAGWCRSVGIDARVIAGEVERERLSSGERSCFEAMGGVWVGALDELLGLLRGARAMVGADTGPTHLAAQLGLPTLALFGPTDPARWAPVGPGAWTLAPERPRAMEWLPVAEASVALERMLRSGTMPP